MVSIVQLSTCFGFVFPMIMGFSNTGQVMIDALAGQLKDDVNQIIKLENFKETLIEETKKFVNQRIVIMFIFIKLMILQLNQKKPYWV